MPLGSYCVSYFSDRVLCFCWGHTQTVNLLPMPPT
jgi:hypothetical protein